MSAIPLNLVDTAGFLVADHRGRVLGKGECPVVRALPDVPERLSGRAGFFSRHRRLVPADTIADVDRASKVVGLRVARETIRRFLSTRFSTAWVTRRPARGGVTASRRERYEPLASPPQEGGPRGKH